MVRKQVNSPDWRENKLQVREIMSPRHLFELPLGLLDNLSRPNVTNENALLRGHMPFTDERNVNDPLKNIITTVMTGFPLFSPCPLCKRRGPERNSSLSFSIGGL